MTIRNIAKALHRSPSTISREINRNKIETTSKGRVYKYYPIKAQELYESRKNAIVRRSMIRISLTILKKKRLYFSPEQIANRKKEWISILSTSAIYRIIHRKQMKITMEHLRWKGYFKRPSERKKWKYKWIA